MHSISLIQVLIKVFKRFPSKLYSNMQQAAKEREIKMLRLIVYKCSYFF